MEEALILGSGPAGFTASIYLARAGIIPKLLTGNLIGGALTTASLVENFPGFPDSISGFDLMEKMQKQSLKYGVNMIMDTAISCDFEPKNNKIITSSNEVLTAKTVLIATGKKYSMLNVDGEKSYLGKGVSYCATCDGFFFREKEVVVIGGGDTALSDAIFLSKVVKKVTLVIRRNVFRGSKILQDTIASIENIEVIKNTVVKSIIGDGQKVTAVQLCNGENFFDFSTDAVFIAIGATPNTALFEGKLKLNKNKFLVVDNHNRTSVESVFAAGDVSDPHYQQAIVAAGWGAKAALDIEYYLSQN